MKKTYKLQDLCCASCASKIENALNKLDFIDSAMVNVMTQKIILETENQDSDFVIQQTQKIIQKFEPECKILL